MNCGCQKMRGGRAVPCPEPAEWRHPRYTELVCGPCKELIAAAVTGHDGWERVTGGRQETELPVIEQVMLLEQAAKSAVLGLVQLYDKAPLAERELAAQAVDGLAEYVAMAMTAIDGGATDLSDLEEG